MADIGDWGLVGYGLPTSLACRVESVLRTHHNDVKGQKKTSGPYLIKKAGSFTKASLKIVILLFENSCTVILPKILGKFPENVLNNSRIFLEIPEEN